MVADIDFCRKEALDEARTELAVGAPDTKLGWVYFENDPAGCEANIRSRNRGCLQQELEYLRKYSPDYKVPNDAVVIPVLPGLVSRVVLRTETCS